MSFTSTNLNSDELEVINEILGESKTILFTGIAELLLCSSTGDEKWESRVRPGVICFVKNLDKNAFFLEVINMTNGVITFAQKVDSQVIVQRRRRWIFVFEAGFRKTCLNFVDDEEADIFSFILFNQFPKLQQFENLKCVTAYTITDRGHVERKQHNMKRATPNVGKANIEKKKEDNLKALVHKAGLKESVLEDPTFGETIRKIYEDLEDELESEVDELFGDSDGDYDYEDDILQNEYGSEPEDDEEDEYYADSSFLAETPTPSPTSKTSEELNTNPSPPPPAFGKLPPPPPPPPVQSNLSNTIPKPTNLKADKKPNSQPTFLDQIKGPKIKLRSVDKTKKPKIPSPAKKGLNDALMGAIGKIRKATRDDDLYGLEEPWVAEMYRMEDWDD